MRPWFLLALLLTACPDPEWPLPPRPSALDAGEPCDTSCQRYRQLGCEEGQPTSNGHTCEEVCNNAAKSGIDLAGPSSCTADAGTCKEVEACSR
jgi:hypothetical protein